MERHAAFPQSKQPQRLYQKPIERVEENEAETTPDDRTHHAIKNDVRYVCFIPVGILLFHTLTAQYVAREKSEQIHEAVPANGQWPDLYQDRFDQRIVHIPQTPTMRNW